MLPPPSALALSVLPSLGTYSGADENLSVWALAVSDVDHPRCVKRSATRYTLQDIWDGDGSKDTKEIKLGTGGLAAARRRSSPTRSSSIIVASILRQRSPGEWMKRSEICRLDLDHS